MGRLEFNRKNFEESKQRLVDFVERISMKETIRRVKGERYLGWHIFQTMDVCLLLLAPFNFKVSQDDIYNTVEAVSLKHLKNPMVKSLWEGTLRGKSHGWPTKSALDIYMDSRGFFSSTHSDEKKFFEWQQVKDYLKFLVDNNDYSRDMFIMLKVKPDILKQVLQLAWWIGEELEKIEKNK